MLREAITRHWIAGAVAVAFLPALVVGYNAANRAYEAAVYEGYLVMVAAESCRPEAGFAGSIGGRLDMTAQMILRQNWRRDGEPCDEGRRVAAFRTPPKTYAEYQSELQRGCPETDDQREILSDFGGKFNVFTYYFRAACERADSVKSTVQWTAAGAVLATIVTGLLARRAHVAEQRYAESRRG